MGSTVCITGSIARCVLFLFVLGTVLGAGIRHELALREEITVWKGVRHVQIVVMIQSTLWSGPFVSGLCKVN